jgi:YbgC/YbaW family acyl-CoA thioester hydrolase
MTSPSEDSPHTPAIITQEEIMFFDTDCGGVVHNIAYLRMIETARTRLAAKLGMALREMAQTQLFPVVVRTEIDYRKPAKLGDVIVIHGHLEKVERVRFWCAFQVRRQSDDQLLITCRQSLALVQMPEGRPQRLPESWATQYAHLKA